MSTKPSGSRTRQEMQEGAGWERSSDGHVRGGGLKTNTGEQRTAGQMNGQCKCPEVGKSVAFKGKQDDGHLWDRD